MVLTAHPQLMSSLKKVSYRFARHLGVCGLLEGRLYLLYGCHMVKGVGCMGTCPSHSSAWN
jgi:hypothetical protein